MSSELSPAGASRPGDDKEDTARKPRRDSDDEESRASAGKREASRQLEEIAGRPAEGEGRGPAHRVGQEEGRGQEAGAKATNKLNVLDEPCDVNIGHL